MREQKILELKNLKEINKLLSKGWYLDYTLQTNKHVVLTKYRNPEVVGRDVRAEEPTLMRGNGPF